MPGVFYPQCRAAFKVIFDGFGGQTQASATVIHVTPISATVHLNGYRQADTFELTFDAKQFPFSPQIVRAAAVDLYLFQTNGLVSDPQDFATANTLVISGLVDDATFTENDDAGVFSVVGRDYTALLLDKQWPAGKKFLTGKPLDKAVQDAVNTCLNASTVGSTLTVLYQGPGTVPIVGKIAATSTQKTVTAQKAQTVGIGHGRTTNNRGIPVQTGKSYWDVIYSVVLQHGLICYVSGTDVIITSPQIVSANALNSTYNVVMGQNLATLEVNRHMGREQVPQIVVASYDPDQKKTIVGKWPTDAQILKTAAVQGTTTKKGTQAAQITALGTVKESIRRTVVQGVKSVNQLEQIAQTYYHSLSRSEATVKFTTNDLQDLTKVPRDLLALRPGNAVQITFDMIHPDTLEALKETNKQIGYLRSLGYSQQVSALIASEFARIKQFGVPFYCKDITFNWSLDDGISIDVEAINFIDVARDDKSSVK